MSGGKRPDKGSNQPPRSAANRGRQRRDQGDSRQLARAGTGASAGGSSLLIWSGIAVVIAAVVIGAAYLVTQSGKGTAGGSPQPPTVTTPSNIASTDRMLGDPNAPVTVDIYGDFRCSACYKFTVTYGVEGQIVDAYVANGKAKLVWHDYLSIDLGQHNDASRDAANAAWCAADQGKFWPMHDWLYANDGAGSEDPSVFAQDRLLPIGQAVGLDMNSFKTCVTDGTHFAAIAAEMSDESRITGTPTVLVNGQEIDPGYIPTYADISAAIDAALQQQSPSPSIAPSAS